MLIATARNRKSKKWRNEELSWYQLLDRLHDPVRTHETAREYRAMSKEDRDAVKDVGGFVGGRIDNGRRIVQNVRDRCLVTLDADNAEPGQWEAYRALWDYTCAVYSTHSHSPEHPRLRWVFPLTRPVTVEEYEPVARRLAECVGLNSMDVSTYEAHRLMYWPSCSSDAEYEFHSLDGVVADPDELLRSYDPHDPEGWRDTSLWPVANREREVVTRELRHQGDPEGKPGMVGLFCRAYDVPSAIEELLPGVYSPAGEGRYTYNGGSTSGGAVLYDGGSFLYSHHATDPCCGRLVNAFDLVRIHRFGGLDEGSGEQDTTRLPSYRAMLDWAASDPVVKRRMADERIARVMADFGDLTVSEDMDAGTPHGRAGGAGTGTGTNTGANADANTDTGKEGTGSGDWTAGLDVNHKTGECEPTINNAYLILCNDRNISDSFAINELHGLPVIRRGVPWHPVIKDKLNGDLWTDADNSELRAYMETAWGLSSRDRIQDALDIVRTRNAFHPVREYLTGLRWDGVERVDTLLIRYLGAEDSEYTRAVTRKWLCAAVKRAMEPGCKFDNMLVLVGPQGVGKSRLAYILSRGWFTDSLGRMDASNAAFERLAGVWIAEVAELAAAKRSEVEDIKNFISKQTDTFRRAYQRETVTYPRQCVFYGTTNDTDFLRDRTGARRFWPVGVTGVDRGVLSGLEDEVDMVWAEAVVLYRAGETLWLDDEKIVRQAETQWDLYSVEDEESTMAGLIEEYLNTPVPLDWFDMSVQDRRRWLDGDTLIDRGSVKTAPFTRTCVRDIKAVLFRDETVGKDYRSTMIGRVLSRLPGWTKSSAARFGVFGVQKAWQLTLAGQRKRAAQEKNITEDRLMS